MLEIIAKGFIIGILVSSPMGPINLLTIQRTLNRGRWHGFVSGLGAMLSDLTYTIFTLLGLSFVSQLLNEYELQLLLFGSVILILFGLVVFHSNPLKGWQPDVLLKESRYFKDFISSFLLTLSNASIILALIGLYTRFSFNPFSEGIKTLIIALFSFFIAALFWWFMLTTIVSRFRKKFKRKGLILLNRVVGSIFILIGLGGIILNLTPLT